MNSSGKKELTFIDQFKKFGIKNVIGYQTVQIYGLGSRLRIFSYLKEKHEKSGGVSPISFSLDEIAENLELDRRYLDAWIHMALECRIFEIENSDDRTLKPAPFIYELLIDDKNPAFVGGMLVTVSLQSLTGLDMLESFKTGELGSPYDSPEGYRLAQMGTIGQSKQIENLFSRKFEDHARILNQGGSFLEVGCGYGNNLEIWATRYDKVQMVGIDIDPNGIKYTKNLVAEKKWDHRIEIQEITIEEFAPSNKNRFDVIMLHQVLHEMDLDDSYRRMAFEQMYLVLKDTGVLIVGEHMVPEMFDEKPKRTIFFEIWHKYLEVGIYSKFYSEKSFKEFILTTPFKNSELIQEGGNYFWAISK